MASGYRKWYSKEARQKAYETIENINSGTDIMMSHSQDDSLLAICSYMTITSRLRLSMISDIDKNLAPKEIVEAIRKNGVIFIYRLA